MPGDVLKRHYDAQYASDTATGLAPVTRWPGSRFEAARRFIPSHFSGGAVLELAAGSGRIARSLLEAMPSITKYTALELSTTGVDVMAKSLDDPRFSVALGDAERLPAQLGRFDLVVMVALIEHLVDPMQAMRSVREHLQPGGLVYIDTPNIAKWTRRLKLLSGRFPSTAASNEGLTTYGGEPSELYDQGHLHYFTYRSLELMLTQHCGYRAVTRTGYASGSLRRLLGRRLEYSLSSAWPTMLSEVAVVAHA